MNERYQAMLDEYKEFSRKFNLLEQRGRIYADLHGRVAPSQRIYKYWRAEQADKAAKRAEKERKAERAMRERAEKNRREDMDKAAKSGIMNTSSAKEEIQVQLVGKINKDIYKCITSDIVTDEVIITDNQKRHIKERHPNDYERFSQYFRKIVEEPDYILEANKPNTAFVLKSVEDQGTNFQLILRLKTSEDPEKYKNSIITFLKIDQKKWEKYLRNKKILYRRE